MHADHSATELLGAVKEKPRKIQILGPSQEEDDQQQAARDCFCSSPLDDAGCCHAKANQESTLLDDSSSLPESSCSDLGCQRLSWTENENDLAELAGVKTRPTVLQGARTKRSHSRGGPADLEDSTATASKQRKLFTR